MLRFITIISLVTLTGCVANVDTSDEAAAKTEQAARICSARCIDGYVLNPKTCTCQPACTTTALCVAGYTWDELQCRCERAH